LIGVNFTPTDTFLFHVSFENSILDYASFLGMKMNGTKFNTCSLKEVNFSSCQLPNSAFMQSNLQDALFNKTSLKQADLSTAYNFHIDPVLNDVKKAKFSMQGLPGLLSAFDIIIE
jgi:uncharacterized protein YjbI with pentapeptide repeats